MFEVFFYQKTPNREIEQAKRNLADYRERSKDNE